MIKTWGQWILAVCIFFSVGLNCKPQIGDACKLSTDCSALGDRLCDTSMPDGYCTIYNCEPNTCPGDGTCVEFHPKSERLARRFCVASCTKASHCRAGYVCVEPEARDGRHIDTPLPKQTSVCLP